MEADVSMREAEVLEPPCETCELRGDCERALALERADGPSGQVGLLDMVREDVRTVFEKDPAARSAFEVLTSYPGLHAVWMHRLAHGMWKRGWFWPARFLSHISRWLTGIEIHPGATIGRRFFIDHGMGIVIGETAEVGDDVLMYKGVVLGGVSLEPVKRHPTIRDGVVLGSNAIVLGPIEVGPGAKIGSGSVVVKEVPACATVVGVPGRVIKIEHAPSCPYRHDLRHERLPDTVTEQFGELDERVAALEERLQGLEAGRDNVEEETRWG